MIIKGRDNKPHIGIFGRRNAGKSSLINFITGQNTAIVSDVPGTTNDPVKKSVEIFGIGPVIIIDTAGIDDTGEVGEKRKDKSLETIKLIDAAIIVITDNKFEDDELMLIKQFAKYEVPFFIIHNKSDLQELKIETREYISKHCNCNIFDFTTHGDDAEAEKIIEAIKKIIPENLYTAKSIFNGLISKRDIVLLVTPIDSEAPEGRMILPQVIAIRNILDENCICVVLKETELEYFFRSCNIKPSLVVTDSQAFAYVSRVVPQDINLTSFSILFAQLKGDFEAYLKGTPEIKNLKDGDKILMLESCTHRVSCDDISRFKIPKWIKDYTGKSLEFEFVNGFDQASKKPEEYAMLIQCGGCMFTRKQVLNRLQPAIEKNIPVSNFGMSIAFVNNIFDRSVSIFKPSND